MTRPEAAVNARSLQAVLRSLAADPPAGDGELLRRFLAGEEGAFAELVRRHGRLVWAVCRNLTGSDAEADDAFQATFLVLLRGARKVRDPARLSAWLHGVAYRVCAKARRAAKRRHARESAAATHEGNGSTVADSAWDRALAAVHEEAGRLPETLRVPFVLCCLEGKGVTEAAEQLGWKLGTLSGRLTRAKDALLARLDARGLTLGAVAGLGLAVPPAEVVAKAAALDRLGSAVPKAILQLSHGVIGMSATSFKVLAAVVLLSCCGLGLGLGRGWTATADAQTPPVVDEVKRLHDELAAAQKAAAQERQAADALSAYAEAVLLLEQNAMADPYSAKTAKWEYDFVLVSDMTQAKFVEFLQDRETRGWEYNGLTMLLHQGKPAPVWVFRRPAKALGTTALLYDFSKRRMPAADVPPATPGVLLPKQLDDVKAIEAEIARLQEQLARRKAKPARDRVAFPKADLPLDPAEMLTLVAKLAEKRFDKDRYLLSASATGLTVEGDKEVIDWAAALIKKLADK